jgi:murein DD-endopeptidase MepM/ murein hydrolase activator NlpD
LTTRYGHLSKLEVEPGQEIRRGEELGLVGSTGRSTGPHLHYEVRLGDLPVSPRHYLPER